MARVTKILVQKASGWWQSGGRGAAPRCDARLLRSASLVMVSSVLLAACQQAPSAPPAPAPPKAAPAAPAASPAVSPSPAAAASPSPSPAALASPAASPAAAAGRVINIDAADFA